MSKKHQDKAPNKTSIHVHVQCNAKFRSKLEFDVHVYTGTEFKKGSHHYEHVYLILSWFYYNFVVNLKGW